MPQQSSWCYVYSESRTTSHWVFPWLWEHLVAITSLFPISAFKFSSGISLTSTVWHFSVRNISSRDHRLWPVWTWPAVFLSIPLSLLILLDGISIREFVFTNITILLFRYRCCCGLFRLRVGTCVIGIVSIGISIFGEILILQWRFFDSFKVQRVINGEIRQNMSLESIKWRQGAKY